MIETNKCTRALSFAAVVAALFLVVGLRDAEARTVTEILAKMETEGQTIVVPVVNLRWLTSPSGSPIGAEITSRVTASLVPFLQRADGTRLGLARLDWVQGSHHTISTVTLRSALISSVRYRRSTVAEVSWMLLSDSIEQCSETGGGFATVCGPLD